MLRSNIAMTINAFFGVVLGLADSVSFEGHSIEELNSAFIEAVDRLS